MSEHPRESNSLIDELCDKILGFNGLRSEIEGQDHANSDDYEPDGSIGDDTDGWFDASGDSLADA